MKFRYYKTIRAGEIISQVESTLRVKVDYSQYEKLQDIFERRYKVISWTGKNPASVFMRLSFPLFLLFFILILIGSVLKWIFTGTGYYKHDGPVLKLYDAWSNRLF